MSSRQIINGLESLQRHREFFTFSPERQRMEYYMNKGLYNTNYMYLYSDDDKVCLGNDIRRVRISVNGKAWAQSDKDRRGLTYDRKTKKVKLWYNSSMYSFSQHEMNSLFDHMNVTWFKDTYDAVSGLVTPTMLGKVLSGKITDVLGFCKEFVKSKPWLKNSDVTPEKLESLLAHMKVNKLVRLGAFIQAFSVAKSGSVLCDEIINGNSNKYHQIYQVIEQALALNEKIDFSKDVRDIMKLEETFNKKIIQLKIETVPDFVLLKNGNRLTEINRYEGSPKDPSMLSQEPLMDLVMQDL